ncbi:MAG: response regulator transcription factor [Pyrinomonadaceae bacterium]
MPRILCVDDDPDSRGAIEIILKGLGPNYEVDVVGDADAAMEKADERPYDAYILDYRMPETSGVELCRWIRAVDRRVPIIFLSGMDRPTDKLIAFEAGATEYFTKPDALDLIEEAVPRLIARSRTDG